MSASASASSARKRLSRKKASDGYGHANLLSLRFWSVESSFSFLSHIRPRAHIYRVLFRPRPHCRCWIGCDLALQHSIHSAASSTTLTHSAVLSLPVAFGRPETLPVQSLGYSLSVATAVRRCYLINNTHPSHLGHRSNLFPFSTVFLALS
jgi:hypothetical protein